jgi:hypothetical protein
MSSPWTHRSGLHICFTAWLHLRLALSNILTEHSTSTPLPWPERHSFTPKDCYSGVSNSGSWPYSPSASLGRPEFKPGFLAIWWMEFPVWFLSLFGFLCVTETCLLHLLERGSLPLDQYIQWHLADLVLPVGQGCWAGDKEMKTVPSESQSRTPEM